MYYIKTYFTYNVFGADEHYVVELRKKKKNGKKKIVDSWEYSTFVSERVAFACAERKIRQLRLTYDAKVK